MVGRPELAAEDISAAAASMGGPLTALGLSGNLAALALDALSAHVAVLNDDGVILLVNAAWRSFAEANGALASAVSEGVNYLAACDAAKGRDSQGAATFAEGIRDVLKGNSNNFELEYACASPHESRWFLGSVTRLVGAGAAGAVITHENITEQKLSRRQLDLALDAAGMGIWKWDRIKAALTRTLKDGSPYSSEYMVTWPDGSDHFVAARGRLFHDEQGKPLRLEGITWDQTQRIRAERSLVESEARYRQLAEIFPETLFEANLEGRITYANAHALRVFKVTEADIDNGINMLELVTPDDKQKVSQRVKARLEGTSGGFTEYRALRKNGEVFDALAYSAPMYEMSRVTGIRGFILDISERKQAEQKLLETNRQLAETTVRANLLAAQAEQASAAKGEFLANMSHEIRTPMNGVIGMTGLLLDTELTVEQRQFAESARSSAESLLALINDILDFSKIEAGKLTLECLDFDVRSVFDDIARIVGLSAEQKNLDLICSVSDKVPAVLRGDPGRVRQILFNLVGNAVKFTYGGEILVRAKVESETESGLLVHFSVRDTGIGIPEGKLDSLFEKFTQVDASTTRRYGGSGLGLAISKQLAELMGGQIGVQSVEGLGSEFWFTALLEVPQATQTSPKSSASRLIASKAGRSGLRVLVAEDNITNQQVALGILRKLGHHADAVANGREVLEALRNIPYDLVLMDVQMPEMDGLDATRSLRAGTDEVLNRSIPVIAMTARAMQGDREKCLEAGMNDYISKPVTPTTLSRVLERWRAHLSIVDETDALVTQQTHPENTPIFNEASLLDRLMGDRSLARVIIRGFLDDVPQQIATLEEFLEKCDDIGVERQAHSIRGAAAVVGGDSLVQMATEIEHAGHRGDLKKVGDFVSELRNRFEQLEKAMKASHMLDAIEE